MQWMDGNLNVFLIAVCLASAGSACSSDGGGASAGGVHSADPAAPGPSSSAVDASVAAGAGPTDDRAEAPDGAGAADGQAIPSSGPQPPPSGPQAGDGDSAGAGSAGAQAPPDAAASSALDDGVTLEGRTLRVGGEPFQIQGVCWNPVGRGGVHPADLDYAGFAAMDAQLMAAAGINTVRTYDAITDTAVLDTLLAHGIRVMNTVYGWGGDAPEAVDARVEAVKDHPAILMWVLGNEWNYNGLYVGLSHAEAVERLNQVAARVRALDDAHPIATIYGEIPSAETVAAMPEIDAWGINAYRGLSFGSLFDQFAAVSDKPMFLGEYGADAYDAGQGAVNEAAQAEATRALTLEILDHGASRVDGGHCLGGTIFEWSDEWWKDGGGSPDVHDVGGIAPGGGPHPDQTFNEEWWGIVDVDRNPRPAYDVLAELYAP